MIIRRSAMAGLGAALVLLLSACSDDTSGDTSGGASGGEPDRPSGEPSVTTVELTVDDQPVDLADAVLKCYDHEGHLMVEAHNADDPDAAHFLMDYYESNVALSIGVGDGDSELFTFEDGKDGQSAEVKRDGASVSVTGTIGVSMGDTTRPFAISASCAEFFDTPPDSSKIDPSDLPSSCPPGQAVCIPEGN